MRVPDKYKEVKAEITLIYHENKGRYGYRCVTTELHNRGFSCNHKTVQRLMRELGLVCRVRIKKYRSYKGEVGRIAPNLLNRNFHAEQPNQKWVTDVTEFHYYVGPTMRKLYLSAILDLCDRRIVSFAIRDTNDAALVHRTLDQALDANPGAHPLLHSDRGSAYTTQIFHDKLAAAGITQSMSRVGKCIDNGPMEGFWGILKRERYYGRQFTGREQLVRMIQDYIVYYNFRRLQRGLGVRTPMEVHDRLLAA